ncbi:peptidase M24, structural domain-containing protein [Syncephalastrum racemosum]|uniref:Peptidase M24, structural domain-containing protein n=1 Tax=Syncephalastrum racemosum TaxID=13706 RepID=A0A1X2H659_SYNRA|nr:peptidase M24, structural domain-containing protein [Syncephalastrum racemosum]
MKKIPTKQHCLRVKRLLQLDPEDSAIIYHRGGIQSMRDDTDVELDFRQESNFFYLTGVEEAGFHVVIDLQTETVHLIPPTIPDYEKLWKGPSDAPAVLLDRYDADTIVREADLPQLLCAIQPDIIFTLDITDTSALEGLLPKATLNVSALPVAIHEARLLKFPHEIQLIRRAVHMSSHAHVSLMQHARPRLYEWELEARFRWACARNGLKWQSYLPIVASGPRTATLHYTKNDQLIPDTRHTLILVDAGGEYRCYGSDVTRTFPASGVFSPEAKTVYNIVLKVQETILSRLKPGVLWSDMHWLGVRILTQELIRIGIFKKANVSDVLLLTRAFYFHGTGHSVGLDVHDVGGRSAGIVSVRGAPSFDISRPLEKDMILTVEPGLYFNDISLASWAKDERFNAYVDWDVVNRYRVTGGVRIEDTVRITEDGIENMTLVPKSVSDIEALMAKSRQ